MATAKFDITESSEEFAVFIEDSLKQAARRAILGACLRVVQKISTEVIPAEPKPPIDRRVYAAGWRAKAIPNGALIQNTVPYSSVIERGAKAENIKVGKKMIDALTEWVMRKGLVGAGKGAAANDARAEARKIAWAIAMSMKKRGIFDGGEGLHILAKALKGFQEIFRKELGVEIKREYG